MEHHVTMPLFSLPACSEEVCGKWFWNLSSGAFGWMQATKSSKITRHMAYTFTPLLYDEMKYVLDDKWFLFHLLFVSTHHSTTGWCLSCLSIGCYPRTSLTLGLFFNPIFFFPFRTKASCELFSSLLTRDLLLRTRKLFFSYPPHPLFPVIFQTPWCSWAQQCIPSF